MLTFRISSFHAKVEKMSHIWLAKLICINLACSQSTFKAYVSFEDTNKIYFLEPPRLWLNFWKRSPTMWSSVNYVLSWSWISWFDLNFPYTLSSSSHDTLRSKEVLFMYRHKKYFNFKFQSAIDNNIC